MSRTPNQIIKGLKFGKWVVISNELKRGSNRSIFYNVQCECGHIGWRVASLLKIGRTKACKSCCKTNNDINTFIHSYFNKVKRRATISDFDFNIDEKYIQDLYEKQNRLCALSNLPIEFRPNWKKSEATASLDRIDNTKGYIKGNVQWLHKDINNMKYTFTEEYFITLCRAVSSKCG